MEGVEQTGAAVIAGLENPFGRSAGAGMVLSPGILGMGMEQLWCGVRVTGAEEEEEGLTFSLGLGARSSHGERLCRNAQGM